MHNLDNCSFALAAVTTLQSQIIGYYSVKAYSLFVLKAQSVSTVGTVCCNAVNNVIKLALVFYTFAGHDKLSIKCNK